MIRLICSVLVLFLIPNAVGISGVSLAAAQRELPTDAALPTQISISPQGAAISLSGAGPYHELAWPEGGQSSSTVKITKDTTHVLRFNRDIARVAVSNPAICDITNAGARDILVNAKDAGDANLIVWDKDNNVATYQLSTSLNMERLRALLSGIDPTANISVIPFNKTVAVYGTAATSVKLKQIQDAAKAFDEKVICFVSLRESKQVLLEVRFAEVDRNQNKDFKFDVQGVTRFWAFGNITGQTGALSEAGESVYSAEHAVVEYETLQSGLGVQSVGNLFFPFVSRSLWLTPYLNFLESKNILRVIARPNLLAKEGEEASFLVGGEYPIPTTSTTSGTTITYKDYGTSLKFTPEVLENDVLRLKVAAEVSELDTTTSVTSGGVSVPGLTKRNQSTIAELSANESLVIAGIITQRITKNNRKTPYLGDVPVLGRLFNADEYERADVELIVVITPHLVRPLKLEEKKEFYKPEDVREAIKVIAPPYSDKAADSIDRMIVGGESFRDPAQDERELAEQMKAEAKRLKEAERTRMNTAIATQTQSINSTGKVQASKNFQPRSADVDQERQVATSSTWMWPWKRAASNPDASNPTTLSSNVPMITEFSSRVE